MDDAGLDAFEKKAGQATGHQVDSEKMRGTNEKVTDKVRDKVRTLALFMMI